MLTTAGTTDAGHFFPIMNALMFLIANVYLPHLSEDKSTSQLTNILYKIHFTCYWDAVMSYKLMLCRENL